ncbi:hypothetical protein LguiA_004553 [Lonicera macranthoides]
MAKATKVRQSSDSRCQVEVLEDIHKKKKRSQPSEKKEWKDAICSVCLEYPHNAVLLLCSSYDKGCRPYMCATSNRYSNCLDQYTKAYTKVNQTSLCPNEKTEISSLLCPLCRGEVKGWTVVGRARKYLNAKKRSCMQDECLFRGTYKELRKHVRKAHPRARPREVDPTLAEKWKKLEHEREQSDVMSTIRSTMPGAIVMGDYVIESNYHGGASRDYDVDDYLDEVILSLESFGGGGQSNNGRSWDDERDFVISRPRVGRIPLNSRMLMGRPRWRRRVAIPRGGSNGGSR